MSESWIGGREPEGVQHGMSGGSCTGGGGGWGQLHRPVQIGAELLEGSSAVKDLAVLVASR